MKITLGGIAKGYAADKAVESLRKNGIKSALVQLGGETKALGTKPYGEKWTIALKNPRNDKERISIIGIDNLSVSTSGDYERYFNENKTAHHIINPRTGYSATELISVTIIADKSIDADGFSTSVFVLGPAQGMQLIEEYDRVEGLIITRDRDILKSSGFYKFEEPS